MPRRTGVSTAVHASAATAVCLCVLTLDAASGQRAVIAGGVDHGTFNAMPGIDMHTFDPPPGIDMHTFNHVPGIDADQPRSGTGINAGTGVSDQGQGDDRRAAQQARAAKQTQTNQIINFLQKTRGEDLSALPIVEKIRRVTVP
jgi:hypothetical protein